jgi:hypothetical protein
MNRVFIYCPNCQEYSQLNEMPMAFPSEFYALCCGRFLQNQEREIVRDQQGLSQVLQEGSWSIGGKTFTAKEQP